MTFSSPEQRREIRAQLNALARAAGDKRAFNYGGLRDGDPVCDYGEKIMRDPHDPDSRLMREATAAGTRLRAFARRERVDIHGHQWIAPERLGGHAETLTGIFNRHAFSPAYRAWEDDCTFALTRALCTQRQLTDMLRHWSTYTDPERIDAAAWFSRLHQKIFAEDVMTPAITCVHGFSRERAEAPQPRLVRGMHISPGYGRRSHEMGFNTHPDARFHELTEALNVIFHENLHAAQYALAAHAASGDIRVNHPLHREARLFAMAFANRESYLSTVDSAYRAHPLESDTHAQSTRFLTTLGVTLLENGLPALR